MFRVRAIQVEHGDSLLVSYGDAHKPHHLLVDGGPRGSLPTVRSVLETERVDGRLRLEVLIVTHYDLDHIQGIIELLSDLPDWLEIGDLWFNGHHHLVPEDALGPREADELSTLIRRRRLPWNARFRKSDRDLEGGAVIQSFDPFSLPGGLGVSVLSPDQDGLAKLATEWSNPSLPPPSTGTEPEDLLGRSDNWPPDRFSPDMLAYFDADASAPNRSSIALLLTFDNKRVLLAGDALAKVLKEGLARHLPAGDAIDLLKVSHHGSKGNTDLELLEMLDCKRFLISTSGKVHKHPDHALIARLVCRHNNPQIVFNYEENWPGNWKEKRPDWPHFEARYPRDGEPYVDVHL